MLNEATGLIFLAATDTPIDLLRDLIKDCASITSHIVIINASYENSFEGVRVIPVLPSQGMEAVMRALPVLQSLLINIAAAKVPDVGIPIRSSKVTTKL
jgi:fructoselysine-6-P-deglycase FrlB-like protein